MHLEYLIFQSLLKDVSMQVAACPNVEYVSIDEIPEDVVKKEKDIERNISS